MSSSSFNSTTVQTLIAGALVLGAGVFYQGFASQRAAEATAALTRIDAAQQQANETKRYAEQYVRLMAEMADQRIDRQEPLSVVSEFSPGEISQVGSLLGTLYQRDGSFFLERFEMAWQDANDELKHPRVALDLDGRKVLLFSNLESPRLTASRAEP